MFFFTTFFLSLSSCFFLSSFSCSLSSSCFFLRCSARCFRCLLACSVHLSKSFFIISFSRLFLSSLCSFASSSARCFLISSFRCSVCFFASNSSINLFCSSSARCFHLSKSFFTISFSRLFLSSFSCFFLRCLI